MVIPDIRQVDGQTESLAMDVKSIEDVASVNEQRVVRDPYMTADLTPVDVTEQSVVCDC